MKEKKVAVIMSTYNGEKFIREQLDSILNQSYKNIELIVRDDGSKDKTVEIVKEYQEKHKNIKLFEGQNLGFVKSFFECIFSPSERKNFSERWLLVKELDSGVTQREIARKYNMSLCKITRGSKELQKKDSAFRRMLEILKSRK